MEQHSRRDLDVLSEDEPFVLFSLIRLRRDLPDGQGDVALRNYRKALKPVIDSIGARSLVASRVLHTFAGRQERWDAVLVTWFPNKQALYQSHVDPRIAMAMRYRDEGFEDVLTAMARVYGKGPAP